MTSKVDLPGASIRQSHGNASASISLKPFSAPASRVVLGVPAPQQ
jgi:hypothetical protein